MLVLRVSSGLRSAVLLSVLPIAAIGQSGPPAVLYASAKAGPNQGWEGSPERGAAISIWGRRFGTVRGANFVSVGGVALTNDADYAEWGATANPTTAKGFQRITFWLNNRMPPGNTGITVTVNGVSSNALPFTVANSGAIRFIDSRGGNDSWDGQYRDHSRGGSHGPWKTPFLYRQRSGTGPGTFFYLRGGVYTTIFEAASGHPALAYIGYFEQGGTNCAVFYPQINGTDQLRYTVTSYPGEVAVFSGVSVANKSNYWTFTNFRWTNTPTVSYGMGDEWSMCATCQMRSTGLDVIGMQFDGTSHHVLHSFGDNFRILANYINVIPVAGDGYDQTTAYPLYLSSGNNLLVQDNEIHGGSMYPIHHYDESRCSGPDVGRVMSGTIFDSNLLDLTRNATNPVAMRAGILSGSDMPGNSYVNTTIRNNIIYSTDNLVSEAGIKLFSSNAVTLNGVSIYNNTIYNVPSAFHVFYSSMAHWRNVSMLNNILSNIGSYEIYVDGGASVDIQPVFQRNLLSQAPRIRGNAVASNNVVGSPGFVNAPLDFHLLASSPAIDAGLSMPDLAVDFDGNSRPSIAAYDIGALEFEKIAPAGPQISVGVSPNEAILRGGQAIQLTAAVSGTSNARVTWALQPAVGSISETGIYTAPKAVARPQSVEVIAIAVADSSKRASVTIRLTPSPVARGPVR